MRIFLVSLIVVLMSFLHVGTSYAELGGQVFYRFGVGLLDEDRGTEVYTNSLNALGVGTNNGSDGLALSAGLDIPLTSAIGPGTLLGEVMVEYAEFSKKTVSPTGNTLLARDGVSATPPGGSIAAASDEVTVSTLNVVVAPKYRLSLFDDKLRPWLIPAGLAFLVNSPPSNDASYLGVGYHVGVGTEYRLTSLLSIGVDGRYTFGADNADTNTSYGSIAAYIGINF